MNGAQMIDAVLASGFDTTQAPRPVVTGWLQEILSEMLARSKWRRATVTIGLTVNGQGQYPGDPNVVEYDEVSVDGARAFRIGTDQLWSLQSGDSFLVDGIVFAPYFSADGSTEGVELYPAPSADGLVIRALVSLGAPALADDVTEVTTVPSDLHGRLVTEAVRLGRGRLYGEDVDEATREALWHGLAERRNSRLGGATQTLSLQRRRRG